MFSGSEEFRHLPSQLREAIEALNENYAQGNPAWFDALAEDATVYVINSSQPFLDRESYREYFEPLLTEKQREVNVIDAHAKMPNDKTAVVTKTLKIKQDNTDVFLRQSQIWNKIGDEWKLAHLHNAQVETKTILPTTRRGVPQSRRLVESIRTINERIATVASVVGVAQ